MASLIQSSWISSPHTTKTIQSKTLLFLSTNPKPSSFKTLKTSSFSMRGTNDESSMSNSSENSEILEDAKPDRLRLALDKAREYKKSLKLDGIQEKSKDPVGQSGEVVRIQEDDKDPIGESIEIVSGSGGLVSEDEDERPKEVPEALRIAMENQQKKGIVGNGRNMGEREILPGDADGGKDNVPEAVRIAMEKATEYQKNKGTIGSGSSNVDNEVSPEDGDSGKEVPGAIKIAMEKAQEYKKNKRNTGGDNGSSESGEQLPGDVGGGKEEVPEALRITMEKAKEYKKNKGSIDDKNSTLESSKLTRLEGNAGSLGNESSVKNIGRKEELNVSSIDFVGLDFSDKKKSRGLPAGLVPVADPFPEGDLPDVEIIVGDASKFGNATSSETKTPSAEESDDLYKPKVSTWGMFPRPSNISKTFGGGKTIRPGDTLETPEDRAAKEARTKQLLADYKRKTGLNIDPKLKAVCEKALKDGDSLMDVGRLKEALPYYQKVMDNLSFQTELHGLAAIQWSICQDSLNRLFAKCK